ncbi:MAG: restriction endonuclease subunit S [Acidobacteria bacterium]|nr:restriction endonuclease subunit S [Acidobacteriota bacterium]
MKAEVKSGYKQTEVGVIPEGWESMSCADLCIKIQDGTHFSPTVRGHDYLYLTSKNIRFGFLDISTADRIDAAQHEAIYKRCDVKHGDLLLTKDGANTGNAALNTLTEQFSLLSSVAFLRFDAKKHSTEYFLQQCLSVQGQQRMKDAMSGNAITRFTLEKIRKLRFPVAPLHEQRAIAEALSDVDELLGGLERLIAKKRDLKQAAMQQLLTGKTRLPGFHGEWEVKRLDQFAPLQRGFDLPTSQIKRGDYPVVYSNGIQNYHAKFMVKAPGVVTGRSGTIGNVHFVKQDFWPHNTALWVTDFKSNDPKFVFYFLTSVGLERFGTGSGVPTLNRNDVHEFRVSVPPSPVEQTAIAAVLSDMDAELTALEQRRDKTRALKQAMMQELLTGKTRLI